MCRRDLHTSEVHRGETTHVLHVWITYERSWGKALKICHFSDWHWGFSKLPEADLYVCTGDMYCNYPKERRLTKEEARYLDWTPSRFAIEPAHEAKQQQKGAKKLIEHGGFVQYLGSPDAPIICVRGNHDFTDLRYLFEGCNLVHEFLGNEVVEVLGLRVTGHRGVPTINGCWADETPKEDLITRFRSMDHTCDIFLTHYPPSGVGLDLPGGWGLDGMVNWLGYNTTKPYPIQCHGHIHECGGKLVQAGQVLFSNAAETYNLLEGNPESGWYYESPL